MDENRRKAQTLNNLPVYFQNSSAHARAAVKLGEALLPSGRTVHRHPRRGDRSRSEQRLDAQQGRQMRPSYQKLAMTRSGCRVQSDWQHPSKVSEILVVGKD